MKPPTILLLEDEFIIAEVLKDTLEWAGFGPCAHAPSNEVALSMLAQGEWVGALVDVQLNGETGFAVAETLQRRGIPFAFCSGGAPIPALFADVPVLAKPWTADALEALAGRLFPRRGD